jgi:hypothetical protein
VERVDSSSRQKATKNNMDRGVAGRSMLGYRCASVAREGGAPETGSRDSGGGGERVSWALAAVSWCRPGVAAQSGRCVLVMLRTGRTRGAAA